MLHHKTVVRDYSAFRFIEAGLSLFGTPADNKSKSIL
jgi:signal recognition particle receptor subunit beta